MGRIMKDSGIAWIGEIPEHWDIHPVYLYFDERKSTNYKMQEQNLLSLSYGNIIRKDINTNGGLLPISFTTYNIVEKRDIIIRPTDLQNDKKSLRTGLVKERGIITSAYIALKPKYSHSSRFYHYMLHAADISKVFYNMGNGVRQGLNYSEFSKLQILSPSPDEQETIADYLDKKTAEIDAAIKEAQELIDKYKEYKQSIITEAVTKGLDSIVPMKDSGVEWIGEIPYNWFVDKVKYHLQTHEYKGYPEATVLSLYRELGIVPKDSRDDNHNVTSEDTSKYKHVEVGNFVVNKMKAWQGSVAVSYYEGIVSPAYYVYRFSSNAFYKGYFHYLLRDKSYTPEFRRLSGGIREGQWDLSREGFRNLPIIIPPIEEQHTIADYLDDKCSQIDSIISKKENLISQLQEYRKSIIFEYVTGKKEVPNG